MAYTISGIYRYRLSDLCTNDVLLLLHDGGQITTANGKAISSKAVLSLLDNYHCVSDCEALHNAYMYVKCAYVLSGNAQTRKSAKAAFNRGAYSFYPTCVHVSKVTPHGMTPCAVDM